MYRIILSIAAVATLAIPSAGQPASPAQAAPPLTDATVFHFFFIHVMQLERAADRLHAQGKDDTYMRRKLASDAALTGAEATLVKNVASACIANYNATAQGGRGALQATRGQPPTPAVLQQIQAIETQLNQVTTSCIETLQSGMPSYRFQMLHDWVIASEAPRISKGPVKASAPRRPQ